MEIGKTRAGTIIEYKPNQTIEGFKSEFLNLADGDKFDYYCVYQWLVVKAKPKKSAQIDDYEWWETRVRTIELTISEECVEIGKLETKTSTSYEMVQLGKNMVNHFWR